MNEFDPVIEDIAKARGNYELLRKRGDEEAAALVVTQILEKYPYRPHALEFQADALRDAGKTAEALALYKKIITENKGWVATERKYADLVFKLEGSSAEIRQLMEADNLGLLLARPDAQRHPGTAAALSLLVPGLGQIYNGELTKGLWLLAWAAASLTVFVEFSTYPGARPGLTPVGYISAASIALCWIVCILDAYVHAPKGAAPAVKKTEKPKPPVDLPYE